MIAVEIKASSAPKMTKGFYEALGVVKPDAAFAAAPVKEPYPIGEGIWVHPVSTLVDAVGTALS